MKFEDAMAPAALFTLLEGLDADLRAGRSATATLEAWCEAHELAPVPARLTAQVLAVPAVPLTSDQVARLGVLPDEAVAYRRVQLSCGGHLLSQAENWFLPDRLTGAMRAALAESDTPFGTVIRPLAPVRRALSSQLLWDGAAEMPTALLRHRALVLDGQGRALAEVAESYQRGLFAFADPGVR